MILFLEMNIIFTEDGGIRGETFLSYLGIDLNLQVTEDFWMHLLGESSVQHSSERGEKVIII